MKPRYLLAVIFLLVAATPASAQVLFDNFTDAEGYAVNGRKWSYSTLRYYFQNGTPDISASDQQQVIRDALAKWQAVTNLAFIEVASSSQADIVISWASGDHGDGAQNAFDGPGITLAHAFPPPPIGSSLAGDVHFDEGETWTSAIRSGASQPVDLASVALHEIGHSLGLSHSEDLSAVMYRFYNGSRRTLTNDDITGIRSIYGLPQPLAVSLTWPGCTYTAYATNVSANASGGFPPYVDFTFETKPEGSGGGEALTLGGEDGIEADGKQDGNGGVINAAPGDDWSFAAGGTQPYTTITRYEPYYVRVRVTDTAGNTATSSPVYIPIAGPCTGGPQPSLDATTSSVLMSLALALEPAAPNPFGQHTRIRFGLPEAADVQVVVYDVLGREVVRLADGAHTPGWHTARFDGSGLAGGVYVVRMTTGTFTQTRVVTLAR